MYRPHDGDKSRRKLYRKDCLLLPQPNTDDKRVIAKTDIRHIKSTGDHTCLVFHRNSITGAPDKMLTCADMFWLERECANYPDLIRVHKQHIIALSRVYSINKRDTSVTLVDDVIIPVGRIYWQEFLDCFEGNPNGDDIY